MPAPSVAAARNVCSDGAVENHGASAAGAGDLEHQALPGKATVHLARPQVPSEPPDCGQLPTERSCRGSWNGFFK